MTLRTPPAAVLPVSADVHVREGEQAASLRYNAPQRTPKFPDTPWGKLRGAQGWSLRELSSRTGINPGLLSRIEHGFGPTPDQAVKLIDAYGLFDPGDPS